ncbi:hypothetical protein GCM10007047_32880 [Cerasicoccus arenae]|uniref:Uncharacterized protein n=1 Tax=Cerasicoccus arenae TaxID=424488 RepID=A0A8J3DL29_9BACT|nr:hypothetical protein GCM10007047_32880 [Cerasicoccus arenae]
MDKITPVTVIIDPEIVVKIDRAPSGDCENQANAPSGSRLIRWSSQFSPTEANIAETASPAGNNQND